MPQWKTKLDSFHATKQGERYTLSESARRPVLDHLLALTIRPTSPPDR